jgi:hypothetical protein
MILRRTRPSGYDRHPVRAAVLAELVAYPVRAAVLARLVGYPVRAAVVALLVACARPAAPVAVDAPAPLPADAVRHYTIWLGGSRIGSATESEMWTRGGVELRRVETMRFLRGSATVELATSIEVDATSVLVPTHVRWTEIGDDTTPAAGEQHAAEAVRGDTGWRVTGATPQHPLALDAVPAELLPLLVRRDGRFDGPVFLPARGFVAGRAKIAAVAPRRFIAQLALAMQSSQARTASEPPVAEATIDLGLDGMPVRVVDGEGVIELRSTAEAAAAPFAAVDLIAATSVPIAGPRSHRLILDGDIALPPLPGQHAQPAATGVAVELSSSLAGDMAPGEPGPDRTRLVRELVAAVRAHVTPDLARSPASSRDGNAAAGDCTTFALAYAALATARGIPTRVVTGLRVDGDRLVRHRWAVSWTGTRWIAVDAAFGTAPAGGDLIGLAVHDADDAGLVSGEAALTQVRGATWSP